MRQCRLGAPCSWRPRPSAPGSPARSRSGGSRAFRPRFRARSPSSFRWGWRLDGLRHHRPMSECPPWTGPANHLTKAGCFRIEGLKNLAEPTLPKPSEDRVTADLRRMEEREGLLGIFACRSVSAQQLDLRPPASATGHEFAEAQPWKKNPPRVTSGGNGKPFLGGMSGQRSWADRSRHPNRWLLVFRASAAHRSVSRRSRAGRRPWRLQTYGLASPFLTRSGSFLQGAQESVRRPEHLFVQPELPGVAFRFLLNPITLQTMWTRHSAYP